MSLRRPPTRVELKADDIIEYEEVSLLVSVGRKGEKCGIAKQSRNYLSHSALVVSHVLIPSPLAFT